MNREDLEKLLGGYATETLTPAEREALFAAALEDQELFDALMREQPLRDLLRDPASRARLLASLDGPESRLSRVRRWFPWPAAVAAAATACAVLVFWQAGRKPEPVQVAQVKPAPTLPKAVAAPPARAEVPAPARRKRNEPAATEKKRVRAKVPPVPRRAAPEAPAAQMAGAIGAPAPRVESESKAAEAAPAAADSAGLRDTGARALFYSASQPLLVRPEPRRLEAVKAAAAALHLGMKYTVLRQLPGGEWTEIAPDRLQAGDPVRLRFVPNDDGYVRVFEARPGDLRQVAFSRVERDKPFEAALPDAPDPGRREFLTIFSRQEQVAMPMVSLGLVTRVGANVVEESDSREGATYVVNRNGDRAQQVTFRITLSYR